MSVTPIMVQQDQIQIIYQFIYQKWAKAICSTGKLKLW